MMMKETINISRRKFLTIINVTGVGLTVSGSVNEAKNNTISFGIIADLHYADKETWRNRHYRDSYEKLTRCIETFDELKPSFIIELGDFIDANEKEIEIGYLKKIDSVFSQFHGDRYYVLGNHDLAVLSKEEFLSITGSLGKYYSFEYGSYHFVVLDGNYNRNGTDYNAGNFEWTETYIHAPQQEWLKKALKKARDKKAFVFVHQTLHDETSVYGVKNAPEVRNILEEAGNVLAVFQGHNHQGDYKNVNGIHYVTLQGAVEGPGLENNRYAFVDINNKAINIKGYGKQESLEL